MAERIIEQFAGMEEKNLRIRQLNIGNTPLKIGRLLSAKAVLLDPENPNASESVNHWLTHDRHASPINKLYCRPPFSGIGQVVSRLTRSEISAISHGGSDHTEQEKLLMDELPDYLPITVLQRRAAQITAGETLHIYQVGEVKEEFLEQLALFYSTYIELVEQN